MKFGLKSLIICTIIIGLSCLILFLYLFITSNSFNAGSYLIKDMWIGNNSPYSNISYCNNCLWITFQTIKYGNETTYYFSEQYYFDLRLKINQPVDIYFYKNGRIRHIEPRNKLYWYSK